MSELTPERIRDAAAVLRQLDTGYYVYRTEYSWTPSQLDRKATILEREQAAEAKREKRIEELGYELMQIDSPGRQHPCVPACHLRTARELITRYPALADGPES